MLATDSNPMVFGSEIPQKCLNPRFPASSSVLELELMTSLYHNEMSIWEGFREYYSQFGATGILLLAKARMNGQQQEAIIDIPDFQHPVHLRFRTTDVPTFRQVIRNAEYDWEMA